MIGFRFSSQRQKDVQLSILSDLLQEHSDDQLAKTALSNSIALSSVTMVSGTLDEMMVENERWYSRNTRLVSVFFIIVAVSEFAFAYFDWRHSHRLSELLGYSAFGVCILVYCAMLQSVWRVLRSYHEQLKRLEDMQLELPPTPLSLVSAH